MLGQMDSTSTKNTSGKAIATQTVAPLASLPATFSPVNTKFSVATPLPATKVATVTNAGAGTPVAPAPTQPNLNALSDIFQQDIRNSSQYKGAMEGVDLNNQSNQATLDFNKLVAEQNYRNSLGQIGAGDALAAQSDALRQQQGAQSLLSQQQQAALERATSDYNLQAGKDAAALQLGTATHTLSSQQQADAIQQAANERAYAQNQKYTKEVLGSRGNAGGQLGFELGSLSSAWDTAQQQRALSNENNQFTFDQFAKAQGLDAANAQFSYDQFVKAQGLDAGNAQFAYDLLMKEIGISGAGRALDNQINTKNLELQYSQQQGQQALNQANLARDTAVARGNARSNVENQLTQLWFDPTTGEYVGPSGQRVSVAQAQASIDASPPPTGQWLAPNANPNAQYNSNQFAYLDSLFGGG